MYLYLLSISHVIKVTGARRNDSVFLGAKLYIHSFTAGLFNIAAIRIIDDNTNGVMFQVAI